MKTSISHLFLFIVVFISALSGNVVAEDKINKANVTVALYSSPTIRLAFLPLFKEFEEQSNIQVKTVRYTDQHEFHQSMDKWLVKGVNTPDVLHGQSAERLYSLANKGLLHPQTQLWQKHAWQEKFRKELTKWVSFKDEIYGLPYGYYTWGMFYKQSLVEKFGPVPQTWDAFLLYCQKLKQSGIHPFPASEKQPWIAAAWFEYLVLRIHGLTLFEALMAGELSYYHPKVQGVLFQWQKMVDMGLFATEYSHYDWEEYIPHFLRNDIGFVFMSSNVASRIYDDKYRDDVQFMAFPKINDIPRYETGPANSFFIAQNSKNKAAAEKFLEFFAQPHIQTRLSKHLYVSPARDDADSSMEKFTLAGHEVLANSAGISPFFDRGAKPEFEKVAVLAFAEFLSSGDVKTLTEKLELSRLQAYEKSSS